MANHHIIAKKLAKWQCENVISPFYWKQVKKIMTQAIDAIKKLDEENALLREVLEKYRDAVIIDAQMGGPRFMGSNASALKRAWEFDRANMP